jgi:signal transduction histidine kinase
VSTAERPNDTVYRSPIWRRHVLVLSLLVVMAIVAFGATEMVVSYGESRAHIDELQQARAREVAQTLDVALENVQRHLEAVSALPWSVKGWLTMEERREEYARLLRVVPSIESVAFVDSAGSERLVVSRRERDKMDRTTATPSGSASPPTGAAVKTYGQVEYQDDYDPYLVLDLRYSEAGGLGSTRVRLALRALARDLSETLTLPGAEAYVVDRKDIIVLHRDPSVMLERRVATPATRDASSTAWLRRAGVPDLLRSVQPLKRLDWRVVVERPFVQAMEPVWDTLARTAAFMLGGIVLACAAAAPLAHRLTRPIRELAKAAQRVGEGNFQARVPIESEDELAVLADGFNTMAQRVQESHTHLEQRVADKTRDLELANRHKSEFLANMSHELRTPLNAIIGFSEVLAEQMFGKLNAKQMEYATDIHGSGQHLLSLINDILDLSKIEAGRLDLESSEFDVRAAIANASTLVRERVQRQGLRLKVDVGPEVTTWRADARRFKQILVNLLSNAVKFTPMGGQVTVCAAIHDDRLRVEVSDTGVGIAESDMPLLFEPFRQVGPSDRGKAEGTGLGLSLVRSLIELHRGTLTVHSQVGEGSTFTFELPRGEA